jgi:hypothetical protein
METYPSPEIAAGMHRLISHIQSVVDSHWEESGYIHSMPPLISVESIGPSYARVQSQDRNKDGELTGYGTHVYCFVSMKDSNTKGMGQVKEGQIFKAAGWKAPAKHARGSIWGDLSGCTPYGMQYLR